MNVGFFLLLSLADTSPSAPSITRIQGVRDERKKNAHSLNDVLQIHEYKHVAYVIEHIKNDATETKGRLYRTESVWNEIGQTQRNQMYSTI